MTKGTRVRARRDGTDRAGRGARARRGRLGGDGRPRAAAAGTSAGPTDVRAVTARPGGRRGAGRRRSATAATCWWTWWPTGGARTAADGARATGSARRSSSPAARSTRTTGAAASTPRTSPTASRAIRCRSRRHSGPWRPATTTYGTRKVRAGAGSAGGGRRVAGDAAARGRDPRPALPHAARAVLREAGAGRAAGAGARVRRRAAASTRCTCRNLAELIRLAAAARARGCSTPAIREAPTVAEIGAAIDAVLGVRSETVLMDGRAAGGHGGRHAVERGASDRVRHDGGRAGVGLPAGDGYAESLPATVEWLAAQLRRPRLAGGLPGDARGVRRRPFDYAAEDAWLERYDREGRHVSRRTSGRPYDGEGRPVGAAAPPVTR